MTQYITPNPSFWITPEEKQKQEEEAARAARAARLHPVPPPVLSQPDPTSAILAERGKVHGNFQRNSAIAIGMISLLMEANRDRLTPLRYEQLNSLLMIAQKMSRILAGDANHPDHWADIQGYAKLAQNTLPHSDGPSSPYA